MYWSEQQCLVSLSEFQESLKDKKANEVYPADKVAEHTTGFEITKERTGTAAGYFLFWHTKKIATCTHNCERFYCLFTIIASLSALGLIRCGQAMLPL